VSESALIECLGSKKRITDGEEKQKMKEGRKKQARGVKQHLQILVNS
jgi:hypothetical protein